MGLAIVPLLAASSIASCVIADPNIELPVPPLRRPIILRDQMVPPSAAVLGFLPEKFTFVVEVDPTASIEARLFIDYDALDQNRAAVALAGTAGPIGPLIGAERTREVSLPDLLTPAPNRCHVIEAIVAFGFKGAPGDGLGAHTPDTTLGGGDGVVWFYSPNGDLSGCPYFDAGVDGAFPDAVSPIPPIIPDAGE